MSERTKERFLHNLKSSICNTYCPDGNWTECNKLCVLRLLNSNNLESVKIKDLFIMIKRKEK